MTTSRIKLVEKLSISLSTQLFQFLETYKTAHQRKSRSQVIEEALLLLRERELEAAYSEAGREVDPDWEVTLMDGLTDEAW